MYKYSMLYDDGKQNILITVTDWGNYIALNPTINGILMIETDIPKYKMHWREAENYAKELNKGGYSDWRLPTTDELKIIYKIKDLCGINSNLDFYGLRKNQTTIQKANGDLISMMEQKFIATILNWEKAMSVV